MAVFDKTSHPGGETISIWQATFTVPAFESLKEAATGDVCVVGAGSKMIVGVWHPVIAAGRATQ